MATRLTDIVQVFKDKWTYGDVEFGYESDINKDHDRQYPSLIIEPPTSVIENVNDGRENYDFEVNFYNLYDTEAQGVVELQKRWDNLQDLANEWLDMVLKNYQDVTVQAYINESGINIERVKEVGNDRLVQLKISFTMSGFTKCFRPISKYPSDIADLVIWLKADSGVTFDIATKSVSAIADQSGGDSGVSEPNESQKPLRYGYDGANDKTYLSFDGVDDLMKSDNLCPIGTDFTAFVVAKEIGFSIGKSSVLSYNGLSEKFSLGSNNGELNIGIDDGSGVSFNTSNGVPTQLAYDYYVGMMALDSSVPSVSFSINNDLITSVSLAGWSSPSFNANKFSIGIYEGDYLKGDVEEVVVFNRVLTDTEIADVKRYLNNKYRIY